MSNIVSLPPKLRQLTFFPTSFPDETFYSLISRYFQLSTYREDEVAFESLFGAPVSEMDFTGPAPVHLKYLLRQLPGLPRIRLGKTLESNCFVALVLPVITAQDWDFPDPKFAEANICLDCAAEDVANSSIGMAYVHREHQLPGVTACRRHAIKLIEACPQCHKSFRQPEKFLTSPVVECDCGWHASNQSARTRAPEAEVQFAANAHLVFTQRASRMPTSALITFFEMHVDHSALRGRRIGRFRIPAPITVGIAEKLEQQYSTYEIASAVARYIRSRDNLAWIANIEPNRLRKLSSRRQNSDAPIIIGLEVPGSER